MDDGLSRWTGSRRVAGLLAACLALASLAFTAPAAAAGYEFVRSWEVDFRPTAIAVDGGSVYVTTSSASTDSVTRYTTAGIRETSWSEQVASPTGVATDSAGNVFVTNLFDDPKGIRAFDRNGNYLGGGPVVAQDGGEVSPFDIDIDPKGDRYITHNGTFGNLPNGVLRFSAAGQLIASWGGDGAGNGQFDTRLGVASDGRGNVYVADTTNFRIQKFTDTGTYVTQWGQLGTGPGQFLEPEAVAVDGRGDVYVADRNNGRIQKFDPSGKLLEIIDVSPQAAVSSQPVDVEVDSQGTVYVADEGNPAAVYVFREAGGPAGGAKPKIKSKSLRLKKGKIKVKIACPKGGPRCAGKLLVRVKKAKLAKGSYKVPAGKTKAARAKPTKRGKRLLARKRSVKVTVELRPKGGGEKVTKKLKLRG